MWGDFLTLLSVITDIPFAPVLHIRNTFVHMAFSALWTLSLGYIPKDPNLLKNPDQFCQIARMFAPVSPVGEGKGRLS